MKLKIPDTGNVLPIYMNMQFEPVVCLCHTKAEADRVEFSAVLCGVVCVFNLIEKKWYRCCQTQQW